MKINKKIIAVLLAMVFVLTACGNKNEAPKEENKEEAAKTEQKAEENKGETKTLRLTTTTSVNDSGLMDYLRQPLKDDTGIEMEIVSKGSGAAIEDGRQGNADVILVHSPKAEKEFVDEGFGMDRISFMHNYFVIVGPEDDPAKIEGLSAEDAFKAIKDTNSVFVSRGDESGTHKKELSIWEGAGVKPEELEANEKYNALGDGMGATLKFASENQGYTLTDLATFLSMQTDLKLKVLVNQSDSLKNTYSVILINPEKVEGTNTELAKEFQDWMTGEKAAELIDKYGLEEYGQQLFISGE